MSLAFPFRFSLRVGLLGLLAIPIAHGMDLPKPNQKWVSASSRHFQVTSSASPSETQEITEDFERFRGVIHRVLGEGQAKGSTLELPSRVFLFSNAKQFENYCSLPSRTGFFQEGTTGFNMAVVVGEHDAREIVYHEYFHYHLRRIAPELNYPLWANEGLASLYQMTSIKKDRVEIGLPNLGWLRLILQSKRIPMARLLQIEHRSPEYQSGPDVPRFYASAWFATHYLMVGNRQRRQQLPEYLGRIMARHAPKDAFAAAFKTTPEALDKELDAYLVSCRMSMPIFTVPLQEIEAIEPIQSSSTTYPEALARLGGLLAAQARKKEEAKFHLEAALKADPACATAMMGMAQLELGHSSSPAGLDWLNQSLRARPDPLLRYMRARASMTQGVSSNSITSLLEDLAEAARGGIGETWALNAIEQVCQGFPMPPEAIPHVETLSRACPGRPGLRIGLARSLAGRGQRDKAKALLNATPLPEGTPEAAQVQLLLEDMDRDEKREAQQRLDHEARQRIRVVEERLAVQDYEGALKLLREARQLENPEHVISWLDQTISQMEKNLAAGAAKTGKPKTAKTGAGKRK